MNTPILCARSISKSFGSNNVLMDVSIEFYPGEVHALIGVNGAGKSTLVKILQGVYQSDSGSIALNGRETRFSSPLDAMDQGVSMVFQELNLFDQMTVTENVLIGKMIKEQGRIQWKKCHAVVQKLLDGLGVAIDATAKVKSLSLAQQQLVEIAKNVYRNPKVLFLDEPSSSLSNTEEQILYKLVRDLKANGIAVVLITHKMDEIFALCDRITILRDGSNVSHGDVKSYTIEDITRHMLGKSVDIFQYARDMSDERGKMILSVEGLSLERKLHDISFSLYEKEILAITGLVGSGKSDLARTLFGVHKPDAGVITLEGRRVCFASPAAASAEGVGYVPLSRKDEGIFTNFNVTNNITVSILDKLGFHIRRHTEERIAQDMMEQFNVTPRDRKLNITSLSGGNQQKAILSRWIAGKKRLILLDEPTRGVDVGAKKEIYDNLKRLAAEGVGVIMFSAETDELLNASHRILVMREGRIIRQLITAKTSSAEILKYAMAGAHEASA